MVIEMTDRILRLPEVIKLVGLTKPTLYRFIRDGHFPHPFQIGPRAIGWKESEIQAWMDTLSPTAITG